MEQQFQVSRTAGTAAIDRGAELLVRVLESPEPAALTDLAKAAGIPKSTASRLLSALERRGLVHAPSLRKELAAAVAYFAPLASGDPGTHGVFLEAAK